MGSIVAKPLSRNKIRNLTCKIREKTGLDNFACFPVIEFLELIMPKLDEDFYLEIKTKNEMGGCHGIALPDEHRIEIREDVYDRAFAGVGRDRFTIAHEIGHYFLHKSNNVAHARTGIDEKIPPYKDPEWQANTFAGELLVSSSLVNGRSIQEIATLCGVSHTVAEIQSCKL